MNLLAVDTTSDRIALALNKGEEKDYFVGEKGAKKHNSVLLNAIDGFLRKNGLTVKEIDVFGAVVGPGSFTGIRIGVATVNALAMALGKKIVTVTSLELPVSDGEEVLTALDCKHDNYYCGVFCGESVEYKPMTKTEIDALSIKKVFLQDVYPKETLEKCLKKALSGDYSATAKPFYMKRSSAERETGILC